MFIHDPDRDVDSDTARGDAHVAIAKLGYGPSGGLGLLCDLGRLVPRWPNLNCDD